MGVSIGVLNTAGDDTDAGFCMQEKALGGAASASVVRHLESIHWTELVEQQLLSRFLKVAGVEKPSAFVAHFDHDGTVVRSE